MSQEAPTTKPNFDHRPPQDADPMQAAIDNGWQQLAKADEQLANPKRFDINGLPVTEVDVDAERAALALNMSRQENGVTSVVTVEQARSALERANPDTLRMIGGHIDTYVDGPAAKEPSISMMTPDKIREVTMRGSAEEVEQGLAATQAQAIAALEANPSSNTGIGNQDFAKTQFNATIFELRKQELEAQKPGADQERIGVKREKLMDEMDLWEKAATGKSIPFAETLPIQKRALEIRKQARETQNPESQIQEKTVEEKALELVDQIPKDEKEARKFAEEQFTGLDPSKVDLFRAYIITQIRAWAENVPKGARYPDTVATIMGSSIDGAKRYLGAQIIKRDGKSELDIRDLTPMQFSKLAKDYLDMDVSKVYPEYNEKFR